MNTITPKYNHPLRSSSLYPNDVSPPESPHQRDEDKRTERGSPNVSPISDSSNPWKKQSPASGMEKFNSNLPVPKKTRKFWNRPTSESPEQGSNPTHWDVYSGEPTTSEKGKPPSTTPSAVKLHADPSPGRLNGYGTSTHISAGNPIGRKRVASRDLNNTPIIRPEWKGAGGRHKIVNPLVDKPLPPGKNPTFPIGSEKFQEEQREKERIAEEMAREQRKQMEEDRLAEERARHQREKLEEARLAVKRAQSEERKRNGQIAADQEEEARLAVRRAQSEERKRNEQTLADQQAKREQMQQEEDRRAAERLKLHAAAETTPTRDPSNTGPSSTWLDQIRPDGRPALSAERDIEQMAPSSVGRRDLPVRTSSLVVEDIRSPLARNPSNEEMKDRRSQALPALPQSTPITNHSSPVQPMEEGLYVVPSTKPKAESHDHDPSKIEAKLRADLQDMNIRDEPRSRFSVTTYATTCDSPPATPEIGTSSPAMSVTPNSILNRKRPVQPAGIIHSRATDHKPTASDINVTKRATSESKRKSLPKSPPEANAVSRVAGLQAKLDNLRRRRVNLQTVIYELTHVIQPSSPAYDMASRKEIKRTVEGLNKELAEIVKDEHETGIKLHRTMKREDEFGDFEPTSIWVRRVTS